MNYDQFYTEFENKLKSREFIDEVEYLFFKKGSRAKNDEEEFMFKSACMRLKYKEFTGCLLDDILIIVESKYGVKKIAYLPIEAFYYYYIRDYEWQYVYETIDEIVRKLKIRY